MSALTDPPIIDTQHAFDSVAANYDGPMGNNELVQRMREQLWRTVESLVPSGARLLELGCGTGIDAVHLARLGYSVVATDWSPEMVGRARARVEEAGLSHAVSTMAIGIQELDRMLGQHFDCIYSDLGPLNCVPDLVATAECCSALLKPGGLLIASVIGRTCPWELVYYSLHGDWENARRRKYRGFVPVNLNRLTVWTRYYSPQEFYRAFAGQFELSWHRGLALFMPPPYLIRIYERMRPLFRPLEWLDDHVTGLPLLRDAGDHFLMVLTRQKSVGSSQLL